MFLVLLLSCLFCCCTTKLDTTYISHVNLTSKNVLEKLLYSVFFFVLKESFCSQTYFSYPIYSITYIYVLRPLPTTKHSSRKKNRSISQYFLIFISIRNFFFCCFNCFSLVFFLMILGHHHLSHQKL